MWPCAFRRGQDYFADLSDKRMALHRGFHYGFAGFNADPDILRSHFDAQMTYSHDSNLRMLLLRRADVAVVTRSYLQLFAERNRATWSACWLPRTPISVIDIRCCCALAGCPAKHAREYCWGSWWPNPLSRNSCIAITCNSPARSIKNDEFIGLVRFLD